MQKVLNVLKDECSLDESSMFLDVGSGLGKPNIHAAAAVPLKGSVGIEVIPLRYYLSLVNLRRVISLDIPLDKDQANCPVAFANTDVLNLRSLTPMTHIFLFDVGMPVKVMKHLAKIFNRSRTAKYLVCFKKPKLVKEFGFDADFMRKISVSMVSSAESHSCFVYVKDQVNKVDDVLDTGLAEIAHACRFRPVDSYCHYLDNEIQNWQHGQKSLRRKSERLVKNQDEHTEKNKNGKRNQSKDDEPSHETCSKKRKHHDTLK